MVVEEQRFVGDHREFQFYYPQRDYQGTWSEPKQISEIPSFRSNSIGTIADLVVDDQNTLHLVWVEPVEASNRWKYARKSLSGDWELIGDMTPSKPGILPVLAVDSSGIVHVAWTLIDLDVGGGGWVYHGILTPDGLLS